MYEKSINHIFGDFVSKTLKNVPIYIRLYVEHRYWPIWYYIPCTIYLGVIFVIFLIHSEISGKYYDFHMLLSLDNCVSKNIWPVMFSTPRIVKNCITIRLIHQRHSYVYSYVDWNILKSDLFSKSKGFKMEDEEN